jgi:Kelch motif
MRFLRGALIATLLLGCGENATSPSGGPGSAPGIPSGGLGLALASNTWTARPPVPRPHSDFAVGTAPNAAGQPIVYVFGGQDETGTGFPTYAYNVATNTWGYRGAYSRAAYMNGVGKIGNRLYFTGGESCCEADFETFKTTWAYEPSTDRLLQKADMPIPTKAGVTGVINGKLYVLATVSSVGGPASQLYRYDPTTNSWTLRRRAPHFHTFGAGGVIDNKFYVVGGSERTRYLDVYDPATNAWVTRAPIPTAGDRLFGAVFQHRLFVLSWSHPDGGAVILKAYSYDPATNSWRSRAAPPVAGPIVQVILNGQGRLFLPGRESSYLYTP